MAHLGGLLVLVPAGQFWREKAGSSGRGTQVARKAQISTHQDQRGLPWPDGFVAFPPAHWGGTANGGRLPESPEAWARTSQGRHSGPKESWLGLRLHDQVQQTGKLAGCDGRNGQPVPEYFNPALSDGGALTGIISGLPAYRGCCPATAGVGSLPPRISIFPPPFRILSQPARKNRDFPVFACPHDGVHRNAISGASP